MFWSGQEQKLMSHSVSISWEICDPSAWRRQVSSQGLINVCKYLMWENEDMGARVLSAVFVDRTRCNKHKLEIRKFHLNERKHYYLFFSIVRVIKHWNRLPREVMKFGFWLKSRWLWSQTICPGWHCFESWGWTSWSEELLSNLNHSMIL